LEDDLDDLSRLSVNLSLPTDSCEVEPVSNHSLLLNNIQKIEGHYVYYFLRVTSYLLSYILFYIQSFFLSSILNSTLNTNVVFFFILSLTLLVLLKNKLERAIRYIDKSNVFISFFINQTGMRDMASARDIVSSIISAANKKIQRRRKNQDEIDNSEHDKVGTNHL